MVRVEVTPKSHDLRAKAVRITEMLLDSKLGNAEAFGESVVRLRFQNGQLTHIKVIDETDVK